MKITKRQLKRIIREFYSRDVENYLRANAAEYKKDKSLNSGSIRMLLMDDFMDNIGHNEDIKDYQDLIDSLSQSSHRIDEVDCWPGYSPGAKSGVKTKKGKGGKRVNNCEKISELDEAEKEDKDKYIEEAVLRQLVRNVVEACYQGKKVKLDSPSSNTENPKKKSKVYVSTGERIKTDGSCKGEVKAKKVQFGDPDMKIKKSNPKARSSFRKRHKCSEKKPKDTPGYWSCKAW